MKQILLSLMTIGLVGIMTVGGAFASFHNSDTSKANTITAGTIDLAVNGDNNIQTTLIDLDNMAPGEYREVEVQLTNEGSLAGDTWMMFTDMICTTGALVEPEVEAEVDGPVDDISTQIMVTINGQEMGTMADLDNIVIDLITLEPAGHDGAGLTLTIGLQFSEDAGNEYQGDTCEFSLAFGINQHSMSDVEPSQAS